MTQHAQNQWDDRVPTGAVNAETAWAYGVEAPYRLATRIEDSDGNTPDRVRVYHGRAAGGAEFRVVFLCSDRPTVPPGSVPSPSQWTNVVTTYLVGSIYDDELREQLCALTERQEVVA